MHLLSSAADAATHFTVTMLEHIEKIAGLILVQDDFTCIQFKGVQRAEYVLNRVIRQYAKKCGVHHARHPVPGGRLCQLTGRQFQCSARHTGRFSHAVEFETGKCQRGAGRRGPCRVTLGAWRGKRTACNTLGSREALNQATLIEEIKRALQQVMD